MLTEIEPGVQAGRIQCSQCGETFPLPKGIKVHKGFVPPDSPSPEGDNHKPLAGAKVSNRTIAFGVLAFMGLVAIVFLGYALQTQDIRRQHDKILPKSQSITIPIGVAIACNVYVIALIFAIIRPAHQPGPLRMTILLAGISAVVVTAGLLRVHIRVSSDPNASEGDGVPTIVRPVRPIELSTLRYLPADTNLIAGVHVAELMGTSPGREFLAGSGWPWNWQQLPTWTGLNLQEIKYLLAGVKVDNNLLPRVILIIETIRPFEADKIKAGLKASKWPDPEAVRFLSNQILVLALSKKDLQAIPDKITGDESQLSSPMRNALKERIAPGCQVWAAGHDEKWDKTLVGAYLTSLSPKERQILTKVQTVAISIRVDERLIVQADFRCTDDSAAIAFLHFFVQRNSNESKPLKINQKDSWVSLQANGSDLSSVVNKIKIPNIGP